MDDRYWVVSDHHRQGLRSGPACVAYPLQNAGNAERDVSFLVPRMTSLHGPSPIHSELLAGCPQLKVLAISREALHLRCEQVLPVSPMQLPSQGQRVEVIKRCEAHQDSHTQGSTV